MILTLAISRAAIYCTRVVRHTPLVSNDKLRFIGPANDPSASWSHPPVRFFSPMEIVPFHPTPSPERRTPTFALRRINANGTARKRDQHQNPEDARQQLGERSVFRFVDIAALRAILPSSRAIGVGAEGTAGKRASGRQLQTAENGVGVHLCRGLPGHQKPAASWRRSRP